MLLFLSALSFLALRCVALRGWCRRLSEAQTKQPQAYSATVEPFYPITSEVQGCQQLVGMYGAQHMSDAKNCL